jgi:DNA replication protein DnaC
MNEDLQQLLQNLKLNTIVARFDEMLATAEASGTPIQTLVAQLLRAEWHARQEQALEARIKRAKFRENWTLESFPFKEQKAVKERQLRSLAELEFIRKAENVIFIGETGVGKSGLMMSLGAKSGAERLSGAVHPGAGSVRRDVRFHRRSLITQALEVAG